tara:strand:+ start:397 stop:558 length:162 start_codon:yes stop_codon:yes gene_type:complete
MPETKIKPKKVATPKWSLSQDDYLHLLRSIEQNSQTITVLLQDVKRIKTRMGL